MVRRRSSRNKVQQFYCPYCEGRMWRAGSQKHFLFYLGASEIQRNVGISRKSAVMLAAKGDYVDSKSWIEDFFCTEHGKLWMKITKRAQENLVASLATREDWQQTTHTIQPDILNSSVSEFTYRMSRRTGIKYYE